MRKINIQTIIIATLIILNGVVIYLFHSVFLQLKTEKTVAEQLRGREKIHHTYSLARDVFVLQAERVLPDMPVKYRENNMMFPEYLSLFHQGALFFFIPPNVCGGCLEKESALLLEMLQNPSFGQQVVFVIPQNRQRDIRALFADYNNDIDVVSYTSSDFSLGQMDVILLFSNKNGQIEKLFATHKTSTDYSKQYYALLK